MQKAIIGLIAAAALGACGNSTKESAAATGEVSLKNATIAEVGSQVEAANTGGALLDAGQWQGTVKILDVALPSVANVPPALVKQMKEKFAAGHSFSSCLTPDEAKRNSGRFLANNSGDCTYDHFTMANGRIDAALTCQAQGREQAMTMTGSYTRTSYDIEMASQAKTPEGGMSMKMAMTAHRTGACAPGDK